MLPAKRTLSLAAAATALLTVILGVLLLVASDENSLNSLCPISVDLTQLPGQIRDYVIQGSATHHLTADQLTFTQPPAAIHRVCYNNGTGRAGPVGISQEYMDRSLGLNDYPPENCAGGPYDGLQVCVNNGTLSPDDLEARMSDLQYLVVDNVNNAYGIWDWSMWGWVDPTAAAYILLTAVVLEGLVVLLATMVGLRAKTWPPIVSVVLGASAVVTPILCLASSALMTHQAMQLQPGYALGVSDIFIPYATSTAFLGVTWLTFVGTLMVAPVAFVVALKNRREDALVHPPRQTEPQLKARA